MRFIVILLIFFVLAPSVNATSCYITLDDISALSQKHRNAFKFNLRNIESDKLFIEIFLPKFIDGQPFKSLHLVGGGLKNRDIQWVIPISVQPFTSDESMLGTEMLIPKIMIKDASISPIYGDGECSPFMQYEINVLMRDIKD